MFNIFYFVETSFKSVDTNYKRQAHLVQEQTLRIRKEEFRKALISINAEGSKSAYTEPTVQ